MLVLSYVSATKLIRHARVRLENEALKRKLGENARKLVKDFTCEKQEEKLVKIVGRLRCVYVLF